MGEMTKIILDAVGFGIGLMIPYIISWAWDKHKQRRENRREVA